MRIRERFSSNLPNARLPVWAIIPAFLRPRFSDATSCSTTGCASPGREAFRRSRIPTASRRCSANSTSGCSPKARICGLTSGSARICARSTVSRACPLPCGRPMRSGSASSVISTPGMVAVIRCACVASAVSGRFSFRASGWEPATSTKSVRARVISCRKRPTPTALPPSCVRQPHRWSASCRRFRHAGPAWPVTS